MAAAAAAPQKPLQRQERQHSGRRQAAVAAAGNGGGGRQASGCESPVRLHRRSGCELWAPWLPSLGCSAAGLAASRSPAGPRLPSVAAMPRPIEGACCSYRAAPGPHAPHSAKPLAAGLHRRPPSRTRWTAERVPALCSQRAQAMRPPCRRCLTSWAGRKLRACNQLRAAGKDRCRRDRRPRAPCCACPAGGSGSGGRSGGSSTAPHLHLILSLSRTSTTQGES